MKLKFTHILGILPLLLAALTGFGQEIKGTVYNQEGRALEGAHVYVLKSTVVSHTDHHGEFHLDHAHVGDTLRITYIGYKTALVPITDADEKIRVVLELQLSYLDDIIVTPSLNGLKFTSSFNNRVTPINNAQEVLSSVPGLFIGQHAGGGKAEQLFLRGFDIDHGTDVAISVDGLPVNMVSHAHGQGYADLHFVIPETIDRIDYGKGPYKAEIGNFATAGDVNIRIKERLGKSTVRVEAGQFNSSRVLGLFQVVDNQHNSFYTGADFQFTDGPFESSQNFSRINYIAKYTGKLKNNDLLTAGLTYFTSTWDASGQIPQRAVDNGLISRFGAIDDTEGGTTNRLNFTVNHKKELDDNSFLESSAYYSRYNFELYSNFTFFLEDPINGDQIKQQESRNLFGINSTYNYRFNGSKGNSVFQAGIGARNDQSFDNQLANTRRRRFTRETIQIGNINETNMSAFASLNSAVGKWVFNPSVRADYFIFQYDDFLTPTYSTRSSRASTISPKFNIFYNSSDALQFYLKMGKGFHSNDTRGVVSIDDPKEALPAAWGSDLGVVWSPGNKLLINTALWYLYLQQEFVYVGDAGIVEPSGRTERMGVDFSLRYQPLKWLTWTMDANYAHARSKDDPKGENFIPLAPSFTLMSTLTAAHESGFFGSLKLRHLNDRPANEDNSIVATGWSVVDLNFGYSFKRFDLNFQILNLFNTEWNEAQFATLSRLQNEITPVEEIHFTPGTPFNFRAGLSFNF